MLDETPDAAVTAVLDQLNAALEAGDAEAAAALFEPQGFWRDLVAFTWNLRAMEGREWHAAADQRAHNRCQHIDQDAWKNSGKKAKCG